MTGRERAIAALSFEPVDRAPIWGGWITKASFLQRMSGIAYWDDPWGSIVQTHRRLGVDLLPGEVYGPHSPDEFRSMDFVRVADEAAAKFREPEDVLAYVRALPDPETLEKQWDAEAAYEAMAGDVRRKQEALGDDMLWLPVFRTCYFNWHVQFGYEPYLMALAQWPGEMKKLFEHAGEVARLDNRMRVALFRDEGLPPAMFNGVDLCGSRGPIVSADLLREIYFPNMKRSLQPLVDAGFTVIWHSDGCFTSLIADLVACGARGFQGFQAECGVVLEDLPRIALPTGRKPALWGSISVTTTLPHGSVADVRRAVEHSIDVLGPGGGFFLGTANTVGPEVPDENLIAMHEHAQDYGAGRGC